VAHKASKNNSFLLIHSNATVEKSFTTHGINIKTPAQTYSIEKQKEAYASYLKLKSNHSYTYSKGGCGIGHPTLSFEVWANTPASELLF
jgi:hypothetical protein